MYKILAIDDEIEIIKIIQIFLTKKGFQVFTAESGEEGLAVLEKENPDLIILDKKMPGMGGRGVLKELQRRKINTPVIILSGSQDLPGHIGEIKEMGYNDILLKPIELNALLENVNKRLGQK